MVSVEQMQDADRNSLMAKSRGHFGADLFGSVCYTLQHGKFRKFFGDLTRVTARLDIGSASALAKKALSVFRSAQTNEPLKESSPRLSVILQQQVSYCRTFSNHCILFQSIQMGK